MRFSRWLDVLIVLLVIIAGIYLLQLLWHIGNQFAHVLLLFFVAWIIAFLLTPLVEALQRLWLPRILAVVLVYAVIGSGVTILILIALPGIVAQGNALSAQFPAYTLQVQQWISWAHDELTRRGITDDYLIRWSQDAISRLQTLSTNLTLNLLSVATAVVTALLNLFVVLVLSFYMTLDGRRIVARVVSVTPPRARGKLLLLFESVGTSFGAFARAQFLLAILAGAITLIVLNVFHVGYAVVAAGLAAVGMLIPFLGPVLAIVPPLLIAAFWVSSLAEFLWIALILWLTQQILVNVLVPRMLGDVVGMHPLLVLFALFGGATVAGVWGALFGVPVTAVAFLMLRNFYHEVLEPSRFYASPESRTMPDEPAPAPGNPPVAAASAIRTGAPSGG